MLCHDTSRRGIRAAQLYWLLMLCALAGRSSVSGVLVYDVAS